MIAWSVSLDVVSLFDLKLKHRPCRSTSWFISSLSDWPFIDFLALLCSKIGSFGCPRAVLIPHWVNSYSANKFCKQSSCKRVLLFPLHHPSTSSVFDLHFTYESSRSLWTRICANYSFLWTEHLLRVVGVSRAGRGYVLGPWKSFICPNMMCFLDVTHQQQTISGFPSHASFLVINWVCKWWPKY